MGRSFGTLEKAVDILCLFSSEHPELSAQEIADKLAMPLSTAYKYLQVFHHKKILSRDDRTNRFYLGLTILKLGLLAAEKISLIEIASPYMKSLAETSLETALLTVLDGTNVVCVDIIESSRAVKFVTGKGSTMPLYAGSPGKAILAFQDKSFVDHVIETTGLVKLNKNTITIFKKLIKELEIIRKQGFSESESEYETDVCSIAAPIFDFKGKPIASIVVAGPAERAFKDNKNILIDHIKKAAKGISTELGYTYS